MKNKKLLIMVFCARLLIFLEYRMFWKQLIVVLYGFDARISLLINIVFCSCIEVMMILTTLKPIFQINTMIKIRIKETNLLRLELLNVLSTVVWLVAFDMLIFLIFGQTPNILGGLRILVSCILCVLVMEKQKEDKGLFFIVLFIVMFVRYIFKILYLNF